MSTIADLLIRVRADTGSAEKDISAFGSKVGGGFKKALLPATAALGIMGVVGKAAFNNLQDGAANAKQTEAVLKSTGSAAGVTSQHVDDLAMSLRRKAGVDDDVIHSGENMLLTFTNVRNEAGRGNDVFDQATKTMLDMSHALGQDTKSSAIQLGKALNDPIKGVTALQRVGVTFTDHQRKQIKTMVDSGHTMAAQKLILHELNREFGGSAEKIDPTTKALANMKLDALDLASGLVQSLMPSIRKMSSLVEAATTFMTQHGTATKVVVGIIAGLAVGVVAVNIGMKVYSAGATLVKAATAAWTAAQWLLNAALTANPIGIVVVALVALGAGLVLLWMKSKTFRNIVLGVWSDIKGSVDGVVSFFTKTVPAAFQSVLTWVKTHWHTIAILLSGPFAPLVALATNAFGVRSALVGAFSAMWGAAKAVWHGLGSVWGAAWSGVWGVIRGFVNNILGAINALIGAWDSLHFHFGGVSVLGHHIGGLDVSVPQIPKVPYMANGGIAMGPTLAMVGEGREPEAILPLSRLSALMGGGRGGGVHIENMNVRSDEDVRLWARDLARRLGA